LLSFKYPANIAAFRHAEHGYALIQIPNHFTALEYIMSSINPFHQLRTHLAKGAGNLLQDDKHFYVFLQEEKNGLELFKQLAQQRRHAAHAMVTYGRPLGDDLTVSQYYILKSTLLTRVPDMYANLSFAGRDRESGAINDLLE
jgi:hypothetical protein